MVELSRGQTVNREERAPMRLIGYWIESLGDLDYLPPQEFVGSFTEKDLQLVADHLEHSEVYEVYRGLSWCRFMCAGPLGHREYSDGRWVWPEGLAHYVRNHNVVLPDEFLHDIRTGRPRIPKSHWSSAPPEIDFWKKWCRENQHGNYRKFLAEIRPKIEEDNAKIAAESARLFSVAAAELEMKEGPSDKRCLTSGCSNHTLVGRAICASCTLRAWRWEAELVPSFNLGWILRELNRRISG